MENLLLRPLESKKTPRRNIVRKEVEHTEDMPSTSFDISEPPLCLSDLVNQLDITGLTEIVQDQGPVVRKAFSLNGG